MYLLGHIGFFLFVNYWFEQRREIIHKNNKILLGIGALFPDLLDKPIGSIFFENGRWLGHSLIFLTFIFIISLVILRYKSNQTLQKYVYMIYLGSLVHLILDLPSISYIVAFWPFFGPFPPGTREGFLLGFKQLKTIVTEILGLFFLVYIGISENWNKKEWYGLMVLVLSYAALFSIMYVLLVGF